MSDSIGDNRASIMTSSPLQSVSPDANVRDDELEFVAFRYIAGELTDSEAAAFEERLAVEQIAREAVARAVEIAHSVAVLAPQAMPMGGPAVGPPVVSTAGAGDTRRPRRTASAVVLLATAASVALVVALDPFNATPPGDRTQADRDDRPTRAARLVEFWSDAEDLLSAEFGALESGNSVWSDEANGEADDSDFGWMLAAVSAELPMPESDSPAPPLQNPLVPETREN
jgi:hypothetical protein